MNKEVISGLVEIYCEVLTSDKYVVGCESTDQQNLPGHLYYILLCVFHNDVI